MKKTNIKVISILLFLVILLVTCAFPVFAGVPSTSVTYSVVDMKVTSSPIEEENYFTVEATYHVSVTNHGWESSVWHQCEGCSGSGVTPRYGDGKGKVKDVPLTCGQPFEGRTWKCRENCDGYDYYDQNGHKGEVSHNSENPWDNDHTNSWDDGQTHIWDKANPVTCVCTMVVSISEKNANSGMVACRGCSGTGSIYNGLVDCSSCDATNQKKCTNCNGTGEVKSFSTCRECTGSGRVTEFIPCDTCGSSGGNYVTVHHDPAEPPSSISTVIDIALDGKVQEKRNITFENMTTTQNSSYDWTKEGELTVEWTVFADEGIGTKIVETTIDRGDEPQERKQLQVEVLPACNLGVEFVPPNAYYRNGTEVISTFIIKNYNSELGIDIRPKHKLTARLTVKNKNTGQVIATVSKKDIVIPKGKSNIVYFKWLVPSDFNFNGSDYGDVILQCDINVGYNQNTYGVNEDNHADNSVQATHIVAKYTTMETPDTTFEERAPSWFRLPSSYENVQTDKFTSSVINSSSFEEWVYANNEYTLKTYNLNLSADNIATPDMNSPSHKLEDTSYHMRSGYGIWVDVQTQVTNDGASAGAYTLPQNATMHLPEYRYRSAEQEFRTLERVNENSFFFAENENAKTNTGTSDNRRIHFTPLYYPDGEYSMKAYVFDCWTPMGMLSVIDTDSVNINGDMYDDWYISHGGDVAPRAPLRTIKEIEVISPPSKTSYVEGDVFDNTGMIVKVTYNNGDAVIPSNYTVSRLRLKSGQESVAISYSENGKIVTTKQEISVISKTPTKLEVIALPHKLNYIEEESLDLRGLILKVTFDDGTEEIIYNYMDTSKVVFGQKKVDISYTNSDINLSAQLDITVAKKTPTSLKLEKAPNKTSYFEETNFDPAGMIIKIVYNNGTEETLPYSETPKLTYKQTEITVRYKTDTVNLMLSVPIVVDEDPMAKWFEFNDSTGVIVKFKGDLEGAPTEVPIPKIIRGKTVTSIGFAAFRGFTKITSVSIPETVLSIGERAFLGCSNLRLVNIPSKVTEISAYAFRECYSLTNVVLPEGLKAIRENAFRSAGLTKIIIPNTVTTLEMWSFAYCTSATELQLSNSIKEIGGSAFEGIPIKVLHIPEGVETVGPGAFRGCESLKEIYIPNSMVEMNSQAFNNVYYATFYIDKVEGSLPGRPWMIYLGPEGLDDRWPTIVWLRTE